MEVCLLFTKHIVKVIIVYIFDKLLLEMIRDLCIEILITDICEAAYCNYFKFIIFSDLLHVQFSVTDKFPIMLV